MSIIPIKDRLIVYQGATLDETWQFMLPQTEEEIAAGVPPEPENFTGYTAKAQFRKALADPLPAVILTLQTGGASPPNADGLYFTPLEGRLRMYVRDETLAAIPYTSWTDDGTGRFTGVCHVEFENAAGERHRYLDLKVTFALEVTL